MKEIFNFYSKPRPSHAREPLVTTFPANDPAQGRATTTYRAGEQIYGQNHPCGGIYCIIDGTVGIQQRDDTGNTTLLRIVDSGATIGQDAYFGSVNHSNEAYCLTDATLCFISNKSMTTLLESDAELLKGLINQMADDLKVADKIRIQTIHLRVRSRLACFLLSLRDRHGTVDESGNLILTLPLTRREMASTIGTRPESLSRAIRALESTGSARFAGKRVVIKDLDDLLDEAEKG
jgi:CRP/FNR family transcriptional regulator